jgi:hypothetical protein
MMSTCFKFEKTIRSCIEMISFNNCKAFRQSAQAAQHVLKNWRFGMDHDPPQVAFNVVALNCRETTTTVQHE